MQSAHTMTTVIIKVVTIFNTIVILQDKQRDHCN